MGRLAQGLAYGLLVGLLGALAGTFPAMLQVEENLGLHALFQMRGVRPAPAEVLVVSLDKVSSDAFGLPNQPSRWPRSLHAELVERLVDQGAGVIGFDVQFHEPGAPAEDQRLATALDAAGNVVLTAVLRKSAVGGSRDGRVLVTTETVVPPVPVIAAGAAAVAPFPLPVVPVKVSQFWTWKASAGDIPTFPSAIFQAWMLGRGDWADPLAGSCPALGDLAADPPAVLAAARVVEFMTLARGCLAGNPQAVRSLRRAWRTSELPEGRPGDGQGVLTSLLALYAGGDTRYLNYYGPPRTVLTVPYTEALRGAGLDLAGRIVLVGFSEQFQPEQKDGFYSVFSDESGLDLSGVEIAATAVANMLDGTALRPLGLGQQALVTLLWGFLAGAFCRLLLPLTAVFFSLAAGILYTGWAWWVFDAANTWLPLVVPLAIQLPVAVLLGILAQFRTAQVQRERVLQALGAYLPAPAVDRLMDNLGDLKENAELVHGTCMATDGEQYTKLAEELSPEALAALMNGYYDVLFNAVEQAGGVVTDVVGDSMMAIWATARPSRESRARACRGALAAAAAVDRFNSVPGRAPLPTRIGLHTGPIRLGNIGGKRHVEFRAVGDIVNTASRIEGLNKHLRTRILVSGETLDGVAGFLTRELGAFLLPGKTSPVVVHELLGMADQATAPKVGRIAQFARALALFRAGDWAGARQAFGEIQADDPGDGPAAWYGALCAEYQERGPHSYEHGAVRVSKR